ncbi:MAG: metallophosphoesterase [Candidatus Helarchaeota archaeon]
MNNSIISRKKIKEIIDNPDKVSELSLNNIKFLISNAREILKKEPNLIKIGHSGKLLFVGDIHGNFESLVSIQSLISRNEYNYYEKIIFLGDFVDRGPMQLESINYVLLLKIYFPNKVILLRGNHETTSMNEYYGFYNVVYGRYGQELYNNYSDIYGAFPLALITESRIFCVHGGLPENLEKIEQINDLNRFLSDIDIDNLMLMQLIWNDPTEDIQFFTDSFRGIGIKLFGEKAFRDFISRNNIKLFIRAHEAFLQGYKYFFDNKLLSIFSAANYRAGNQAHVVEINKNLDIKLIKIG